MEKFEFDASTRADRGKGASRRLRRDGKVPGVVYGGHKDPVSVTLGHTDMLLHCDHEPFYSHILTMKLDGVPERVVLKDMQRHVYRRAILHMDFLRISESEMLTMRVPIHFINEENCVGVKTPVAIISHLMSDIEVICLPKDLPEYITVDLQPLNAGDSIHVNELQLPPGVQIASLQHGGNTHQAVVSVHNARGGAGEEGGA